MRYLKTVLLFFVVAVLSACTRVPTVSAENAAQLFNEQKAVIIDVREQEEWDEQHIEGAILIPLDQVESRIGELAQYKDSTIIMQCRSGRRSDIAGATLIKAGFSDVLNLEGGILAWDKDGLATVRGKAAQ